MDLWTNLKGSNSAKLPSKVEDDWPKEKQACDISKNESSQLQNDKFCDCRQKWQLTTPKRWNSARLLQFSNLTASKTKQFRETPFKNGKLRDFLQKWKVECRADSLLLMHFAIFPSHLANLKYPTCHEKVKPGHTKCWLYLSNLANLKIWCSKMQPLSGNQRPDFLTIPNVSHGDVSCTAPATRNSSLQILFKHLTPAIVLDKAAQPTCSAHFGERFSDWIAPATKDANKTPKSAQTLRFFF